MGIKIFLINDFAEEILNAPDGEDLAMMFVYNILNGTYSKNIEKKLGD